MSKRMRGGLVWVWFGWVGLFIQSYAQEAPKFDVFEYQVEGVTLLPAAAVEKAVYPHLGEQKTLVDVEKAREDLEKVFHGAGYLTVLVSIPQQKVDGGVVRLAVTEASVDRLRVVGSRYFGLSAIKSAAPELAEGKVPNFPQMQQELAGLNRSADRRVAPVLRPGKTPGTIEVELKVEDQFPLHGSLEVNNRYSQETTPTRLSANVRYDNLWDRQHSLGLTMQTVPENPSESQVISANYSWPLASGNYLAFYGVRSDSAVAAVGTLNVVGKGTILGMRYIRPLGGDGEFFQTATFGVDYKDFQQSVNLIGSGGFSTPITYLPFTIGWDGSWNREKSSTRLGAAFNFHVRGLVGKEQEFADKRFKGRPGFGYLRGSASHTQNADSGWRATARVAWQLSPQALVSNEQFAIGGVDTVRGYLESAALGDTGYALTLETSTSNFGKRLGESVEEARLQAFVDLGSVRVIDPITATDRFNLVGAGVGLRVRSSRGLSLGLDWAVALEEIGATRRGDNRVHFKLGYEW